MNYKELAETLLEKMVLMSKFKPQKQLLESTRGEAFVLQYIGLHESHVIPSEISGAMDISAARIAVTLNCLESKGYITRKIDSSDRRRILIGLTPEGKEQAEKYKDMILKTAEKMLSSLGERDAKEYIRITGRIAQMAQNYKE